jgi:hemerythrin superfamily protein
MDIYTQIKNDHQLVKRLLDRILWCKNPKLGLEIFEELKKQLLSHNEAEEKSFYKVLEEKYELDAKIDDAVKDHEAMGNYLAELDHTSAATNWEAWQKTFLKLKKLLDRHLDAEETVMFSIAKRVLDRHKSEEISQEMQAIKTELLKN